MLCQHASKVSVGLACIAQNRFEAPLPVALSLMGLSCPAVPALCLAQLKQIYRRISFRDLRQYLNALPSPDAAHL